ncbi:protein-L-isoaspartate(D-aspartate) O-methyltransferase [Corticicoccus populi]|uniref:Protein-L-isoaspartate O-methyltransferase n=1 Tax=Corticicoccus populi TaxID=1812821 RepID=A0ABW5X0M5_9STAP
MKYSKSKIKSCFLNLDRKSFMDIHQESAYFDRAVPIGHGQTISQPSLVLSMTLYLDLEPDSKVLEIGTGSGFQTALLAELSRAVYTIERINALYIRAEERLTALGYSNIHFLHGDGHSGWQEHAPFDRIMVTAAGGEVPQALINHLAPGGRMIIPVGDTFHQELKLITKSRNGEVAHSFIEHVMFVEFKSGTE